eukprot:15031308-Alexandrium_andersonii.AAC.1
MSASLVGSEMCIRDRCRGSHEGTPAHTSAGLRAAIAFSPTAPLPARPAACLLYTSDAADDM